MNNEALGYKSMFVLSAGSTFLGVNHSRGWSVPVSVTIYIPYKDHYNLPSTLKRDNQVKFACMCLQVFHWTTRQAPMASLRKMKAIERLKFVLC